MFNGTRVCLTRTTALTNERLLKIKPKKSSNLLKGKLKKYPNSNNCPLPHPPPPLLTLILNKCPGKKKEKYVWRVCVWGGGYIRSNSQSEMSAVSTHPLMGGSGWQWKERCPTSSMGWRRLTFQTKEFFTFLMTSLTSSIMKEYYHNYLITRNDWDD